MTLPKTFLAVALLISPLASASEGVVVSGIAMKQSDIPAQIQNVIKYCLSDFNSGSETEATFSECAIDVDYDDSFQQLQVITYRLKGQLFPVRVSWGPLEKVGMEGPSDKELNAELKDPRYAKRVPNTSDPLIDGRAAISKNGVWARIRDERVAVGAGQTDFGSFATSPPVFITALNSVKVSGVKPTPKDISVFFVLHKDKTKSFVVVKNVKPLIIQNVCQISCGFYGDRLVLGNNPKTPSIPKEATFAQLFP